MIDKGERALTYSGKFNGDFGHFTLHPECREAELAWNKMVGSYGDEFFGLSELEPDDWEWLLSEYPIVAARMNVTAERITDYKAEQQRMWEYRMAEARKREAERLTKLEKRK